MGKREKERNRRKEEERAKESPFYALKKSGPVLHIIFGVLCIVAGILCIFRPAVFFITSEVSQYVAVVAFIGLGIYLIVQGYGQMQERKK